MRRSAAVVALLAWSLSAAVWAQYKVVDAKGRVTYTDVPPVNVESSRVTTLRTGGPRAAAGDATSASPLPPVLQPVVQRYPVVLYAMADCAGCDAGRAQLQRRGVPFEERLVITEGDAAALSRLSGGAELPVLRIGEQVLHGYEPSAWTAYLTAAGYPLQSALQAGYRSPAPQPLTPPPAERPVAKPDRPAEPLPLLQPSPPSGIAF